MLHNRAFLLKRLSILLVLSSLGVLIFKYTQKEDFLAEEVCAPYNGVRTISEKLSMAQHSFNLYKDIADHPNLPTFMINSVMLSTLLPDISSIRWTGIHWQEDVEENPSFLLYSAHYDDRMLAANKNCNSQIRILGLYHGRDPPSNYYCTTWFNATGPPALTVVSKFYLIDWQGFSRTHLIPYIFSCCAPKGNGEKPKAVSLVKTPCERATNILQLTSTSNSPPSPNVEENLKTKPSIAVCGPALYYYRKKGFATRFIEWIELLRAMGASKIILYRSTISADLDKVLHFYEKLNVVQIISFHYPPPYLDLGPVKQFWTENKREEIYAMENIYFTDCVLRFKDKYDYIAHFDPDEMPILKRFDSMVDLLATYNTKYEINDSVPAAYYLEWRVFYPDLLDDSAHNDSDSMYILRHNRRPSSNINSMDDNVKSFYDTKQVLGVYSHQPLLYADGTARSSRRTVTIQTSDAYLGHYRTTSCGKQCDSVDITVETGLDKFVPKIKKRIKKVTMAVKMGIPYSEHGT